MLISSLAVFLTQHSNYSNWSKEQDIKKKLSSEISCHVFESKEEDRKDEEPEINIQDQELDPKTLLKFIAEKQNEDPKLKRLMSQISKGTYDAKMEAEGTISNLRIEENGALMQLISIRTSKVTEPNK